MQLQLKEDQPGQSPPGVNGKREQEFFDAARGAHDQQMRTIELGVIGRLIGGEANSPVAIALILALAAILFCIGCLVAAAVTKDKVWSEMFERCLAFLGVIVAYVFGRGSRA